MSVPKKHRPGDLIVTECKPKWWPPWKAVPCTGIRLWQRWGAMNPVTGGHGYPDGQWRASHVGIHLGDGKVFEVTAPLAKWTPIADFVDGPSRWILVRRQWGDRQPAIDYPDEAIGFMHDAADGLVGTLYDVGQLLNHVVNDLYGVELSQWERRTDLSKGARVCSAGTAYVEEYARRAMMGALGEDIGERAEPWPRAFSLRSGGYLHTERVPPAAYVAHDDYYVEENGRA